MRMREAGRLAAVRQVVDGSHHDWFEGRSPKCCLIAFIDDATGRVLAGRYEATETTEGYLGVPQQVMCSINSRR
jgi:hypothetical protein